MTDVFNLPLFRLAFRPFFLFGATFAVIAMAAWIATLNGWWNVSLYGGPFFWHVHEMLFGFVAAIVVGFLLTAVRNWTSEDSVSGLSLAILVLVWAVPRVGFLVVRDMSVVLAAIDISFMLVAAVLLAIPILAVRQWRNLFFVPILVLFAAANAMMHVGQINQDHRLVVEGAHGALGLICVLMVTMGGRIIPSFTANGTRTPRVEGLAWLDTLALGSVWVLVIVLMGGLEERLPGWIMAGLFGLAALANFFRWVRWRFWITMNVVLLWTLHFAYFFIIAGFATLAASSAGAAIPASAAWHLVTVGGMGGLILSMVSRVSLGHTGRDIIAMRGMIPAYVCVSLAAMVRSVCVILRPGDYLLWINTSGALWIVAFGSFALCYVAVLTRARVDDPQG
ncbi:MAG TPA: NnrS family protein [Pseudomonadales bacterium]|nr:NnrS family protein [Pseudomonadales bacterium]